MLCAENISKSYGKKKPIINDFNFRLKKGQLHVVMGESGSGKSTLLAIMAGLLNVDKGSVTYGHKNIYELNKKEYQHIHRNIIGYVPQSNILMKKNSVIDNIVIPHLLANKDIKEDVLYERAYEYLKKLDIYDLKNRYPYEISGGEAKRVSIARALLMKPKVIIADEPTTGLDKKTGKLILGFLADYVKEGNIGLLASHDERVLDYECKVTNL